MIGWGSDMSFGSITSKHIKFREKFYWINFVTHKIYGKILIG